MFDLLNLTLPEELSNLEQSLHKRVFMVLLRMSTHKESKVITCYEGTEKEEEGKGGEER